MVVVDMFGWVVLNSPTKIEDDEDRRQRSRSVRADVVRIL
jgi:hypothetical protein